jgi:nicotinamide mononucleotide adenylyltransferase
MLENGNSSILTHALKCEVSVFDMKKTRNEIPESLKGKYRHKGEPWGDRAMELPYDKSFGTVVAIMRANPPHINHTAMLRGLCERAVDVKINLGSSNDFGVKNPFKIEEREDMIKLALKNYGNFRVYRLPDFHDDDAWFNCLYKTNKPFSEILSNNPGDMRIYREYQKHKEFSRFDIIVPTDVIDQEEDMTYAPGIWDKGRFIQADKPMYVSGTFVRAAMVNDWNWRDFLDPQIAEYIEKNRLTDRIKQYCQKLKGLTLKDLQENR